jgi:hypothetical protein
MERTTFNANGFVGRKMIKIKDTSDNVIIELKVGNSYRIFYNKGNPNNMLIHVRAIVDKDYIVTKVWKNCKWRYRIEYYYLYQLLARDGMLTKA